MSQIALRLEDGKRLQAENLHALYNRKLKCANCGYANSQHGAFNKDSAGKADINGSRYRRFVCRSTRQCGKSIGVTEFLALCRRILSPHGKLFLTQLVLTRVILAAFIPELPFQLSRLPPVNLPLPCT